MNFDFQELSLQALFCFPNNQCVTIVEYQFWKTKLKGYNLLAFYVSEDMVATLKVVS